MVPQRGAVRVFDPATPAPRRPARLDDPLPARGWVGNTRGERGLARALAGGTAWLVFVGRRVEQARVLPHTGDDHHRGAERIEQVEGGELAVHNGDDGPVRQPAPQRQQHQAGPLRHGAMAPALALGPRLARGERGQHRQGPDAAGEGYVYQHHGAQPAQAAAKTRGFARAGRVRHVRAATRVVEAPGRADARPAATLEGVVDTDDDRT